MAASALLLATPVTTWWMVGDMTASGVDPSDADYWVSPPSLTGSTELGLGSGAAIVLLSAMAVLVVSTLRGRLSPRWWGFALPLVGLGLFIGWSFRVVTAGVYGANLGGGFVVLVSPIVTSAALVVSARNWRALTAGDHPPECG